MKQKLKLHQEIVEILNKPGRYLILSQYTNGGQILSDDNDKAGFTHAEALAIINRLQTKIVKP